jgi:hypothetical protein
MRMPSNLLWAFNRLFVALTVLWVLFITLGVPRSFFRQFWWQVLVTLVAVPAIFYGAVRGLAVAALWVYHGYKPTGK